MQLKSEWYKLQDQLDYFVQLYHEELLTFEEMEKVSGAKWWTIKQLFKNNSVERLSVKQRAELKMALRAARSGSKPPE